MADKKAGGNGSKKALAEENETLMEVIRENGKEEEETYQFRFPHLNMESPPSKYSCSVPGKKTFSSFYPKNSEDM